MDCAFLLTQFILHYQLSCTFIQPFNIFGEPLFRAKVFHSPKYTYLFVDVHHSIAGGVSLGIFPENLTREYLGKTLAQYFYYTYLSREHEKFQTEEYKEAKKYFLKFLSPGKEGCQFPTPDHETTDTELGKDIKNPQISVADVENAKRRLGVSRNIISIATAILALKNYCRENAIRINFLSNNRTELHLRDTIGLVFKIFLIALETGNFPTR